MQKAAKAQSTARSLRDKAKKIADPKERERMLNEAYDKEIEAHGHSKLAQRMESGAWQGAMGGAGIGGGVGLGLGAVVGTLVGGLVSLPTTGLGALVGTGVGAIHGPFIKFGGSGKKFEDAKPEEVVDALEQGRVEELPPDPEPTPPKKKPRKIEIRSQASIDASHTPAEMASPATPTKEASEAMAYDAPQTTASGDDLQPTTLPASRPRKPKKIEIRSRPKNETVDQSGGHDAHDSAYAENA